MNNKRSVWWYTAVILFALLFIGSVFMVSWRRTDLFETCRCYWTVVLGLLLVLAVSMGSATRKGGFELPVNAFLEIIGLTGIPQLLFALAQFFKLIPSFNRFYAYTGSFDNPAIFAMLLSVCVPIAVYYACRPSGSGKNAWWAAAAGMYVFIGFSESRTGLIAATLASAMVYLNFAESLRRRLFNNRTLIIAVPLLVALMTLLYWFKADSANGRLLMWRVSMDMVKDRPLFGFGAHGFTAHYMQYQAQYLALNPESPFLLLADNVNNPFNEYLLVLVNFGLAGFAVLLVLLFLLVRRLLCLAIPCRILLLSLTAAIMVWSFFSYPFSNPFIWAVSATIVLAALFGGSCKRRARLAVPLSISSVAGIVIAVCHFVPEREWQIVSQRSLMGETEAVLPQFRSLHSSLDGNARFLYNFGAELHFSGHYEESLNILQECSTFLNDYDVQMLMADCHQNMGDTLAAIDCYAYAGRMVPCKFQPQYQIMNLYLTLGDSLNAVNTAETILAKDVKVDRSKTVQRILREAGEVLENHGNQTSTGQ